MRDWFTLLLLIVAYVLVLISICHSIIVHVHKKQGRQRPPKPEIDPEEVERQALRAKLKKQQGL